MSAEQPSNPTAADGQPQPETWLEGMDEWEDNPSQPTPEVAPQEEPSQANVAETQQPGQPMVGIWHSNGPRGQDNPPAEIYEEVTYDDGSKYLGMRDLTNPERTFHAPADEVEIISNDPSQKPDDVRVRLDDGRTEDGWSVDNHWTNDETVVARKSGREGLPDVIRDIPRAEFEQLQAEKAAEPQERPTELMPAVEPEPKIIQVAEQRQRAEDTEEEIVGQPSLPESTTLESLAEAISASESKVAHLEGQLNEARDQAKEAIDAGQLDKASKRLEKAKQVQSGLKKEQDKLKRMQRRLKSSQEILDPANILDIKDEFERQLSKEKDRRRRLQDDEPIDSYAEMLKDSLIAKYAQTGAPKDVLRHIPAELVDEIKALMSMKQADLEAHLPKATVSPSSPPPQLGSKAAAPTPKVPEQLAGFKDLLPPGFDLPENLRQQVQDRLDSPELEAYTDPEGLIYPGLVLINPSDPDHRRLVLALYKTPRGAVIPVVNIEGEPGLRNSNLDELHQKIKSGELVPEADYQAMPEGMDRRRQRLHPATGDYLPPIEPPPPTPDKGRLRGAFNKAKNISQLGIGGWLKRKGVGLKKNAGALIAAISANDIPDDNDRSDEANRRRRRLFVGMVAGAAALALVFAGDTEKDHVSRGGPINGAEPTLVQPNLPHEERYNPVLGNGAFAVELPANLHWRQDIPNGEYSIVDNDGGLVVAHVGFKQGGQLDEATQNSLKDRGYNTDKVIERGYTGPDGQQAPHLMTDVEGA